MNAIQKNDYTLKLNEIGNSLKQKVKAIICFSAHWQTEGLFISGADKLKLFMIFQVFQMNYIKLIIHHLVIMI